MAENTSSSNSKPTFKWFEEEMIWKSRKKGSRTWVAQQPELPEWSQSGAVPLGQFVRLWAAATSLSGLKSKLFWLSLEQIEATRSGVSAWLSANDVEPLAPFGPISALMSNDETSALLNEGALKPLVGSALDLELNPPSQEELDLTPTPARPNEDPLLNKTFNEIMHMPEARNERQAVTMMGGNKGLSFSAKH